MNYILLPITKEEKRLPKRFKSSKKEVMKLSQASRKRRHQTKKKDLQAQCLNAENYQNKPELKWILEILYDIQDEAMNDLLKEYTSNFATKYKTLK
ncbi:hypothetical protein C2G38_2181212 [Gigaspora rosea]|uniref:Uncharacterized protein n=1 Tax=Gigaspora rosea TaxID=44941 RepID=A0A397VD49_9GLOM|nr:hypothetical protein C2G38_2181212 [Gigaspora rosea]